MNLNPRTKSHIIPHLIGTSSFIDIIMYRMLITSSNPTDSMKHCDIKAARRCILGLTPPSLNSWVYHIHTIPIFLNLLYPLLRSPLLSCTNRAE